MAPSKLDQDIAIPNDDHLGLPEPPEDLSPVSRSGIVRPTDTNQAYQIVKGILRIADELASLPDLKPCSSVNTLFSCLVDICVKPRNSSISREVLENKRIRALTPRLREMSAVGEGELERAWAGRILEEILMKESGEMRIVDGETKATRLEFLKLFPYYDNYLDLCTLELSTLLAVLPHPLWPTKLKIVFIGSGPLPLTSFLFSDHLPTAHITNIDRDFSAIDISSNLARSLGYAERIDFLHECAEQGSCLRDFDIVCLAALVGMDTDEKRGIMREVSARMRDGALLCVRSAVELRSLLYPVVEFDNELREFGLEMVVEVRPWNHIVNSTLVMRTMGENF